MISYHSFYFRIFTNNNNTFFYRIIIIYISYISNSLEECSNIAVTPLYLHKKKLCSGFHLHLNLIRFLEKIQIYLRVNEFLYLVFNFSFSNPSCALCADRPCFNSSDTFLFCSAVFLSISLLASLFPVTLPFFSFFLRPCLIHAWMPDWARVFVHGHTFLYSWSGPMTLIAIVSLLHVLTFLSHLTLVLFVSFV